MTVTVEGVSAADVLAARDQIVSIYRAVFSAPPYEESDAAVAGFADRVREHAARSGFRGVLATEGDVLLGFAYGYRGAPGQWWHDVVQRALDPALAEIWLADAFEVVELAVTPTAQRRGIGGQLHDTLVAAIPTRTAVLSTAQQETAATHLYRRRGWVTLRERLIFPGVAVPFSILGLDLGRSRDTGVPIPRDHRGEGRTGLEVPR